MIDGGKADIVAVLEIHVVFNDLVSSHPHVAFMQFCLKRTCGYKDMHAALGLQTVIDPPPASFTEK